MSKDKTDQLTINEDYAKKFTYMKERQALEKAKLKYGNDFMDVEEDEESEDVSEDSEGELINDKVMTKFIETYIKLKDDNLAKEFLVDKNPVFKDDDFIDPGKNKKEKESKIFTVNDALINYAKSEQEDNIFSVDYEPKKVEKFDPDKDEFLKKIADENEEKSNNEDFIDDGFLKLKPDSDIIVINEEKKKENQVEEDFENLDIDKVLQKAKIKPKNLDTDLLKKIWGDDKNLDKNERFLRNYILSEAWLENEENKIHKHLLLIDKEDEEKDEVFDEYEFKYNHRFEEEGGANLTTYQRNITDSYRIKDDTRSQKRKQKELRKEEEKQKFNTELQMAKAIKKEDLKKKIDLIGKIAGTDKIKAIAEELENEFDADKFDEKMNEIFNQEYYEGKDKGEDIEQVIEEKSFDYKTNKDILNKSQLEKLAEIEEEGWKYDEENINDEENLIDEENLNDINDENEWFYCDECRNVIKENKIKYDCEKCEDYLLCKECFKAANHPHKMKKSKVPLGCKPPHDWKNIIDSNLENQNDDLICHNCSNEIINNYYFICHEESCKNLKFCKTCRGIGKSIHEHKLSKFVIPTEEDAIDPKEKLESMVESLYTPHTDHVIAKQIPTKFHYTKVEKDESGFTDEMLLFVDDRTLNKFIPLRKLAPYKEKYQINEWQKKKMLKELEKEVEKKKSDLYKQNKKTEETIARNTKLIGNKKKAPRLDDTLEEYKKKKRLETYGL
jgi:protein KRI1